MQDAQSVRRILTQVLTPVVESLLHEAVSSAELGDAEALAEELADTYAAFVGTPTPTLSDYAVSREGIYAEHP